MYEQPKNLGFICAAQITHVKHVNNLFSAKPSDTEEVGGFIFPCPCQWDTEESLDCEAGKSKP